MKITYCGHAGFLLETDQALILIDPWFSKWGAFDSSWFQLPRNHHLVEKIQQLWNHDSREKYLLISHDHLDHYDREFLESLTNRGFQLIVPRYRNKGLRPKLKNYPVKKLVGLMEGRRYRFADGYISFYLDDTQQAQDTAMLISADDGTRFFNMNDCKIHDRVDEVIKEHGQIHAFACQFSGAMWHPVCYSYSPEEYARLSRDKNQTRFKTVVESINKINPDFYIPSAGPACFLDSKLFHLNFEEDTIFPNAWKFVRYLDHQLTQSRTNYEVYFPEDRIDLSSGKVERQTKARFKEEDLKPYLTEYAQSYKKYFEDLYAPSESLATKTFSKLVLALEEKMAAFPLRTRLSRPLYFKLNEKSERIKCDFQSGRVSIVDSIDSDRFYSLETPSWAILRVLEGNTSWEDWTLSFRVRLHRNPDVFDVLNYGFISCELEDLKPYCEEYEKSQSLAERCIIHSGKRSYEIHRICPHQGADLSSARIEEGRYLVCARHGWRFDLENKGKCTINDYCIHAKEVTEKRPLEISP